MPEFVIVTDNGPLRILRLNRPAKQNALTHRCMKPSQRHWKTQQ